jgi:hypothetical protein
VSEEATKKPAADRSVGELVSDLSDEVKRLVRDEIRLAAFELQHKGKKLGFGAGLFGAAALFLVAGIAALTGKKEVTQAVPPVPEEAITGVREDVDTVKQGVHS